MRNALVSNRCLIPGVTPPLNSPFVHEWCLFVWRAGRRTGFWEHWDLKCACGARERLRGGTDRILLCSALGGQGAWARFCNLTERARAQQAYRETEAPGWVTNLLPAQSLRNPNRLSDRRMSLNCSR